MLAPEPCPPICSRSPGWAVIDRIQIDRELEFIGDVDERIKQSEATIRAITKPNGNVKLLKTFPGIGEFFAQSDQLAISSMVRSRSSAARPSRYAAP